MSLKMCHLPSGPPPLRMNPLSLWRYLRALRKDPTGFVTNRFQTYGDLYYAKQGDSHLFVTRSPEIIGELLQTQAAKFKKTETGRAAAHLKKFLGNGLLNSNGDFWRQQRRCVNPAFHSKKIQHYADIVVAYTERALASWKQESTFDVSKEMMDLTSKIVAKTLFDHEIQGHAERLSRAMLDFREGFANTPVLPWLPTAAKRRADRSRREMHEIVMNLIQEREEEGSELEKRFDLLSALLSIKQSEDQEGMTKIQLRDEILTLFLAGHDTTAHAITWTLFLLSQNPEAEKAVRAEIDALPSGALSFASLQHLTYTKQCLEESMRLYPPAYVIS
ncbi:MAG: cytochrome P450, partial [Myxococcota bacterium]